MDQVNAVVGEMEMLPLKDDLNDEEKTAAGFSRSPQKGGKMYVNKFDPKPPPGF